MKLLTNKEKQLKYYCSATSTGHGNWLEPLGFINTKVLEDADVVIFGGGADIESKTYSEESSTRTYTSPDREKKEKEDFHKAQKLGIPVYGTCRGMQLLCAMAGGKLIQDVTNHHGDHSMTTYDKSVIRVNSIHHQMVNPSNLKIGKDYKVLGWTTKRISTRYLGAKDRTIYLPAEFKEIEAIYFPKIKGMGIQSHPEMMLGSKSYGATIEWMQNTFMKFFNNEL